MPRNVLILSLHHRKVFICRLFELIENTAKNYLFSQKNRLFLVKFQCIYVPYFDHK